jgi:hypothetical protein
MQNVTPRDFDPMSIPGLSAAARKAVNAVFDAMSTWRSETANTSEKNIEQVIEKVAAAGHALGWPEPVVDATRVQMQNITKMQIQMMDHMMDTWEEQLRSPNPSAMLSKMKSLRSFGPAGSWPGPDASATLAFNPFQAYMQFLQEWQKAWTIATGSWSKAGGSS